MISVKRENMVATASHNRRSSAVEEIHEADKLAPGAKVKVIGLLRGTLTYKDQCWPDQSKLNGAMGYIMRREIDYWIVELEPDNAVI